MSPNPDQPTPPTRRQKALAYVREHPGADTYDVASHMGESIRTAARILIELQRRKLVGRQAPIGTNDYLSTWYPEVKKDA